MPEVVTPSETEFVKDVEMHVLTVIRDEGVYRHIRCARPGTNAYSFDILTWPGNLLVTGDMGSWLFARLCDMFEFFRRNSAGGKEFPINPDYWSEKLKAADCKGRGRGGATEYSEDIFKDRINDAAREVPLKGMSLVELIGQVEDGIFPSAENEELAHAAAQSFELDGEFPFQDFWEVNCHAYRHHFIWCLYAIVWAIRQYDTMADTHEGGNDGCS